MSEVNDFFYDELKAEFKKIESLLKSKNIDSVITEEGTEWGYMIEWISDNKRMCVYSADNFDNTFRLELFIGKEYNEGEGIATYRYDRSDFAGYWDDLGYGNNEYDSLGRDGYERYWDEFYKDNEREYMRTEFISDEMSEYDDFYCLDNYGVYRFLSEINFDEDFKKQYDDKKLYLL